MRNTLRATFVALLHAVLMLGFVPTLAGAAPAPGAARGVEVQLEEYDQGAQSWRAGDREAAAAAWKAELERLAGEDAAGERAGERARLAYNLGNAAYRDGRYLDAVGWYTASLRLAPRSADARANLDLARAEAGLPPLDGGELSGALLRSMRGVTESEARWLALLGVVLAAAGLLFEALRGGASGRWVACLGLAALALLWVPLVARALGDEHDHLVIEADGLSARSEPRPDAKRVATLDPGSGTTITDRYLDWARVRTEGGELWVRASGLFPLDLDR